MERKTLPIVANDHHKHKKREMKMNRIKFKKSVCPRFKFLALALAANLAQLAQASALRGMDSITVGTLGYLLLPFAVFLGFIVFDDIPAGATIGGGIMIFAGGLTAAMKKSSDLVERTRAY